MAAVLAECPRADVLVTSRERLRVQGEHVYPVPVLERAEARQLFVARARAVRPDFEPDKFLDDLCARLDDLPLALELAAARSALLSTEQLLERLGNRLDLLRGGRDAETRQQTLASDDRVVVRAARARRAPAALRALRLPRWLDARSGRAGLQEPTSSSCSRSSTRASSAAGSPAVSGCSRRSASSPPSSSQSQLRRNRSGVATPSSSSRSRSRRISVAEATAAGRSPRHDLVLPERENIRTALEWLLAAGEIEAATRLAVSLEEFWITSDPTEGRRWLSQLLERESEIAPELHVRAVRCLGESLYIVGDFAEGGRLIEQSLEEYRRLGDDWGVTQIKLRQAADASFRRGDLAAGRALCEEALESDRSTYNEAQVTRTLGGIAFREGRREEAIALLDKSADLADEINFRWWQAGALQEAGEYSLSAGSARRRPAPDSRGLADQARNRRSPGNLLRLDAARLDRGDQRGREEGRDTLGRRGSRGRTGADRGSGRPNETTIRIASSRRGGPGLEAGQSGGPPHDARGGRGLRARQPDVDSPFRPRTSLGDWTASLVLLGRRRCFRPATA